MLSELYIKNLAIIEEASIPFTDSFNVFTGETGAGKSILINGINAVLGQRVTKDIVRAGCDKAVITALFTELSGSVVRALDDMGISHDDDQITLTREIFSDGGSTARVNMIKSSVAVLKEIGGHLVNIHGQHDNQILLNPEQHINILDSYGGLAADVEDYRVSFRQLQDISRKLKKLTVERKECLAREMLLREKAEEISAAAPEENEDEELETEFKIAQSSENIVRNLYDAYALINGDEDGDVKGASEIISTAYDCLSSAGEDMPAAAKLADRIEGLRVELADIASEIYSLRDSIDTDPERCAFLSDRIGELERLKKKYGPELSDVIAAGENARRELDDLQLSFDEIEKISTQREHLLALVSEKAKALSAARERAAERFSKQVEEELSFLNMPDVKIRAHIERGNLTATGMDTVEFMISTNPGEGMKAMSRIASGGELSRIMLALKNVISDNDDIHTLIFDEIDTGVSGLAAQKIGIKLKSVSKNKQVLCVTHLSQMAAMADNHLLIEKRTVNNRTFTSVHQLDFEERKREIARIMVGGSITATALQGAEEMLREAGNS